MRFAYGARGLGAREEFDVDCDRRSTTAGVAALVQSVDLVADREGVITNLVNGGTLVNHQNGVTEELVTQVGDLTEKRQWQTSSDGQLLVHDWDYDPSGGSLAIIAVGDAFNGKIESL